MEQAFPDILVRHLNKNLRQKCPRVPVSVALNWCEEIGFGPEGIKKLIDGNPVESGAEIAKQIEWSFMTKHTGSLDDLLHEFLMAICTDYNRLWHSDSYLITHFDINAYWEKELRHDYHIIEDCGCLYLFNRHW
jgi:hypothetical protein